MDNENKILTAIQRGEYSNDIHKYTTTDRLKEIIQNNSLYFSSVAKYNDPFEFKANLSSNFNQLELFTLLKDTGKYSDAEATKLSDMMIQDKEACLSSFQQSIEKTISKLGVCCLSQKYNNLLMWAHYGNDHKGVVLKFKMDKDLSFFSPLFKVDYCADFPKYNYFKNNKGLDHIQVKTKSIDWAYEEEMRIIKEKEGLYQFNKIALFSIYFGLRTPQDEIDNIIKLATENGFEHLIYKKATIKEGHYSLEFKAL